jgi:hypothetical protein
MAMIVHKTVAMSLQKDEDRGRIDYYYKLSTETENKPTYFEISFYQNNAIYRYGFEIMGYEIVSEWLYKKVETDILLFERTLQNFKINSKGFPEGNKYKDEVNKNVLFLSHLAQNNTKEASIVLEWFRRLVVISGLNDHPHKKITNLLLNKSDKFKTWLSLAVRFLGISTIDNTKADEIISYHNKFDSNNIIVGSVPINFELDESEGTKKLIYLLGVIFDVLSNSKVVFIDEFDAKLHPNLSRKLFDFFHVLNKQKAQFILTAHDAGLLDKALLRRDQIWFVDKDKFGSSHLYPMSDFDSSVVRNSSDFRKKYLESAFGAADTIDITKEIIDLLHE